MNLYIMALWPLNFLTNYCQIERIKNKLVEAKKKDKNFKVFGADNHKYILNKPATESQVREFENKYSVSLPNCYKTFITQIGNGGCSYLDSGAGPFYGIYPLGKFVGELLSEPEKYLKNDCVIYSNMTDEFWESLTNRIEQEEDELSEEEYNRELGGIYAGILPVGSQGCTYLHGIVLNGAYRGRVVNLDEDGQKPQFAYENNFLDWYERWLDEVISGDLLNEDAGWFGYNKGGSEEELLSCFFTSGDSLEKEDCLVGLMCKNKLSEETLDKVQELANAGSEHKPLLTQLLCQSDIARAKPYLLELAKTDLLSFFKFIYWYVKKNRKEWLPVIEENISRIKDEETLRFCIYILEETGKDYGNLLVPFTKSKDESIRVRAFSALGGVKNTKSFWNVFAEGLHDSSNEVIVTTLKALEEVKDKRLLKHYKSLAERFPVEEGNILVFLNHRLKEYGLTNKTILSYDEE